MKKSTLMLIAGAVIAFFAIKYFSKKSTPASGEPPVSSGGGSQNTLPEPGNTLLVKPEPLPAVNPPITPLPNYVRYNGPAQRSGPVDLVSGDKIIVAPGTTSLQSKVVSILGKPEYTANSLEISTDWLVY